MKALTLADKILVAFLTCAMGLSFVLTNRWATSGSVVIVEVRGAAVHKALLSESGKFLVHGTHGLLTVEIRDRTVAVESAECPNHVCVRMGRRWRSGDVIVCVPNETIIRILNGNESTIRATTG
jgi:hypothetical protein